MDLSHKLLQRAPHALSETEIQDFIALVRAGGEVGNNVLEQNVRNAESLLTIHRGECLAAVGALKRPTSTYRDGIVSKSGVTLNQADFPFELGYIFVLPSARGQGLASKLSRLAMRERDHRGVFATTRVANDHMAHILRTLGFEAQGKPYASGRGKYKLRLFLRPGGAAPSRRSA
jgi:ribosomal protein S18 acetylase RimI-like enzyme